MRIFISSVIAEFQEFREAAAEAICSLGHEVLRSEDFVASPAASQVACLSGVRDSDGVILLLGPRYGSVQSSGKSPTHEEFEAAKEAKPIFAFVQSDISAEPPQQAFIDEVRDWSTGTYTVSFTDAETLRTAVTTAIHRWEVESASTKVDPDEMASRALMGLPTHDRRSLGASQLVSVSVIGAPRQPILRPSEIEDTRFQRELQQRALFGEPVVFDTSEGIDASIEPA